MPTMMRALPQKMLSRFILTSIATSAPATRKSADQNIQAQQNEDDRHSIIAQNREPTKERCKDQEHHCTDDDEVQSMTEVSARIFAQQPSQYGANPNKAGNQRPHVRPGSKVAGLILIVQNPTDPRDNGRRNRHAWRASQQANDKHEQPSPNCPHGPGKIMVNPVLDSRDLPGNDQPPADQYQQNAEKEISSILSHESTLLVKISSLILYDKRRFKLPFVCSSRNDGRCPIDKDIFYWPALLTNQINECIPIN